MSSSLFLSCALTSITWCLITSSWLAISLKVSTPPIIPLTIPENTHSCNQNAYKIHIPIHNIFNHHEGGRGGEGKRRGKEGKRRGVRLIISCSILQWQVVTAHAPEQVSVYSLESSSPSALAIDPLLPTSSLSFAPFPSALPTSSLNELQLAESGWSFGATSIILWILVPPLSPTFWTID